ncbi:MAG: isoleucine--tRNA ligase [Candidatus Tectomicrobia bacterium]|nr:isoleucine--tRNA ligase [Candidatus Tectomicrobia bacterium]
MTEKLDYKSTLNLPRTDFPMKANLPVNEPERLRRWAEVDIYGKLRQARRGAPKFILHDGPPYANGHIHMGTALNKVIKDFVVRAKAMEGFDAPYVPGWDCHGLPIEHQVDRELGKEKDTLPPSEKRRRCRAFAERFVRIQREEFERLGAYGAWDAPYLTMSPRFEAATVRELGKFFRSGAVYRGKKPVHWCTHDLTALAEAEVEYEDHTSPSIFVEFPYVRGGQAGDLPGDAFVVIWTTTPWTLPANLGVAFHPEYDYALVEAQAGGKARRWILAERLTPALMEVFGVKEYRILKRFTGRSLEGAIFRHPFYERDSVGVLAEYVTLDQGTGAVHTSPGHGREDYETGQAYGLEVLSPVDDHGRFYKDLPLFGGMSVWEANPEIVKRLEKAGRLVAQETIRHQYPHCWRCHNPIIFRATPQWFISMEKDGLRRRALEEINRVEWLPAWGRERIYGMIENRPDWCISRQRTWGVPITAFTCGDCGEAVIDARIAEKAAGWIEKEGVDAWFDREVSDFTPQGLGCPSCGGESFRKVTDILDVWFESGVTHAAVIEPDPDAGWPADMYLEGSDQHRGWFHSSLLTAVGTRDRAPYRTVLTHGYVVDAEGRKMSKSLGNVISPLDVIKKSGAEIVRLWVASEDYREDMRISDEILKRNAEAYRRIRNTFRFLLGNLYDFDPGRDAVPYDKLSELDRLMLHRLAGLTRRIREAFGRYEFHAFYHAFHNFCAVDLSAFYLDVIKDRLYCEQADSPARRGAQTVLYQLADSMVRLMAPILPFTAEEVWESLPARREASVHLALFPEVNEAHVDEALAERWGQLLEVRDDVLKQLEEARKSQGLGSALNARVTIRTAGAAYNFFKTYEAALPALFIVSAARILPNSEPALAPSNSEGEPWAVQVEKAEGEKCERCWMVLPTVGEDSHHPTLCHRCASILG